MDLSQIPLSALQKEHGEVDVLQSRDEFSAHPTVLCIRRSCSGCPVHSACDALRDPALVGPNAKSVICWHFGLRSSGGHDVPGLFPLLPQL